MKTFVDPLHLASHPAKLLYSLKDPKTGNTLFLSNFPVAIPGSTHLTQHNIRAVLSVIEFDKVDGTYELAQKAFLQGKHMHKVCLLTPAGGRSL